MGETPLEDYYEDESLHLDSVMLLGIVSVSTIGIILAPQGILNGTVVIGIPYLVIVAIHSFVCLDFPSPLLYDLLVGSILQAIIFVGFGFPITPQLVGNIFFVTTAILYIVDQKSYIYAILSTLLISTDSKYRIYLGVVPIKMSPLYENLLFSVIPTRLIRMVSSGGITVLILRPSSSNQLYQFSSQEEFIEEVAECAKTSTGICGGCSEETEVCTSLTPDSIPISQDGQLCTDCREKVLSVAVENEIITEEELLVSTI